MKSSVKHLKSLLVYSLLATFAFGSCIDDTYNQGDNADGEKLVTFALHVPSGASPKTYALAEDPDENEVKTIDILVFGSDNKYKHTRTCDVIALDGASNKKKFTVKLATGLCNLVILANARDIINTAYPTGITAGTDKEAVLALLVKEKTGKWSTTTANDDYLIPMWGEKNSVTIDENANASFTGANAVKMARMLAKIDVSLTTAEAKTNLKLVSVFLHNRNTQGRLTPDVANWNDTIATAPTVVAGTRVQAGEEYTAITTPNVAMIGEIYTFEALKNPSKPLEAPCIVIKGYYTENNITDSQPSYYRIDFANKVNNAWEYLDLLRNHSYTVNITKVRGRGFPSEKEAFEALPVNIEADIVKWNEGLYTEVITDGQYTLFVSQASFTLNKMATTGASTDNKVTIRTDYPKGWKVSKIVDDGGWLTTDKPVDVFNTANVNTPMTLNLTENTGAERTGYIHITAGRIEYVIKVTQTIQGATTWSPLSLITGEQTHFTAIMDGVNPNYEGSDATSTAILQISSTSPTSNATAYTLTSTSSMGVGIAVARTETYDGTHYVAVYKISVPVQTVVMGTKIVFADVADPSNKREVVIKVADPAPIYGNTGLKGILVGGIYWAPVNVGATTDDATILNEASVGRVFQWGRSNISWVVGTNPTDVVAGPISISAATTGEYKNSFITRSSNVSDWADPIDLTLWHGDVSGGACPTGWRLPNATELQILVERYDASNYDSNKNRTMFLGDILGKNLYLPLGGRINYSGISVNSGIEGYFWSSEAYSVQGTAYLFNLRKTSGSIYFWGNGWTGRSNAESLRCVLK